MDIFSPGIKSITAPEVIKLLFDPLPPKLEQFIPVTPNVVPAEFLNDTPVKYPPVGQV